MPKRKEPKDVTPMFDLSEQGIPHDVSGKVERSGPTSKPPVPAEAKRPRRAKTPSKEPISSTTPDATVAGEIDAEVPVQDEHVIELTERKHVAFPEGMKGSERPLSFEVRDLGNAFESAKQDFEAVADAVDRRSKEIADELAGRNFPAETIMVWREAIEQREGLSQKLDAAMDKMIEARKAYVEAYEKLEAERAENEQGKKEMEQAIDQFIAENPPQAEAESAEETMWQDRGEKESQEIASVRQQIAGNELEEPIRTPGDLAALGFDQVFIDAYKETEERFEKADAARKKVGFFKKMFGGGKKLGLEYEAARSDFQSMHDDVIKRRVARERGLREAAMTQAQLEAQRKSDEHKKKRQMERGILP